MRHAVAVGLLLSQLVVIGSAEAQQDSALTRARAQRQQEVQTALRQTLLEYLSKDLKTVMSHQEIFYSRNNRYAGELSVLLNMPVHEGTELRIVGIHPAFQGYAVEASNSGLSGLKCVGYVGAGGTPIPVTKFGNRPKQGGTVVCDSLDRTRE